MGVFEAIYEPSADEPQSRASKALPSRNETDVHDMVDERIKLLMLPGSLRRDSYNGALLRAAAGLAPSGVAAVMFDGLGAIPFYDGDRLFPVRQKNQDLLTQLAVSIQDRRDGRDASPAVD